MKTKSVSFAYATSPAAEKFGFKDGCYTVKLREAPGAIMKTIAGYDTPEEAFDHADKLPEQWDRHTLTRGQFKNGRPL